MTSSTRPLPTTGALACALVLSLGSSACSHLPRPPTGPTPKEALTEVPYPPPPARVETIPPPKNKGEVWVDGQWTWDGSDWQWMAGAWVKPPEGAYFTPWSTVRRSDGQLFFAQAAWRSKDGKALSTEVNGGVCAPAQAPSAREARR